MMHAKAYNILKKITLVMVFLTACASHLSRPDTTANPSFNQTGIAELDKVITTVLAGDTKELHDSIRYTLAKCTNSEGLGGPPKCLENEAEGTLVEVLPFLGPEGHFIRKEDIENWRGLEVSNLYAVYQISEAAYSDENYPAGEYALVFIENQENKTYITLQVEKGRIVRIDYGFGYPPDIPENYVIKYLVKPFNIDP